MIRITEQRNQNHSIYLVENVLGDTIISSRTVDILPVVSSYNNNPYYLLYDSDGNLIMPAIYYLNHNPKMTAHNTRRSSMFRLGVLYSFCAIFNKRIEELDNIDNNRLSYFIRGESIRDVKLEMHLLRECNSQTANDYFSVYREFFAYLNVNIRLKSQPVLFFKGKQFKSASGILNKMLPDHITFEEYNRLIYRINQSDNPDWIRMRDKVILGLMYEAGLRIGEVLGLTAEDITLDHKDDTAIGMIYIRNRCSDRTDQRAKTLTIKITNKTIYKTREYNTCNVGYQLAFVSMDLYRLICDYIDSSQSLAQRMHRFCPADSVKSDKDVNYYIFLNRQLKLLTQAAWNVELRKLFKQEHISLDKDCRGRGLNHLFRHGFAIHLLYDKKVGIEIVQYLLRDKSEKAVKVYTRPTRQVITRIQDDMSKDIQFANESIGKIISDKSVELGDIVEALSGL